MDPTAAAPNPQRAIPSMDPTAAAAAATTSNSTSRADALASFFQQAMHLRRPDPSSSSASARGENQHQHQDTEALLRLSATLAPSPSPDQQRYSGAAPPPGFPLRMTPMMQAFQNARQYCPNPPQPNYSSAQSGTQQHQSGPSSSSAQQQPCSPSASQYQPLAGVMASQHQRQAVVTASQYQPQAAVSASQYQPQAPVPASQYQQQALATASQYQSQATVPASQYQQQALATASQYLSQAPVPASRYQQQALATANQYQPQAPVTASQYQPQAVVPASQYQQQALATASQYQTQAMTASPYQQSGEAAGYGSSFHQRMRVIQAAKEQRRRTLEETRSALLSGAPMELHLVTFPDSAAHVVHLLLHDYNDAEDHDRIRHSVLAGVTRRVHDFIDDKEGHEVLVALLRACTWRDAEVNAIVRAAVAPNPNGRNSLLRSTKHHYWENSVKQLLTAAGPYPHLQAMLVDRLLCEGLLENHSVDKLLYHIFAMTQQEDIMFVVQCALNKIDALLVSTPGSKCLVACYGAATGNQLRAFNDILLARAAEIAMGKFSNFLMQHVLKHADDETRTLLVDRLMASVFTLSLHNVGSFVVEACYQKAELLPRVLAAFLHLDDACLIKLVQGEFANYVVQKLLDAAIYRFPREAVALARRIHGLPNKQVLNQMYARKLMWVVQKIVTRYSHQYS